MSGQPCGMDDGKPVFSHPQTAFKRLMVTHQTVIVQKETLRPFRTVEVLGWWGGVFVHIGPLVYANQLLSPGGSSLIPMPSMFDTL